MDETQARFRARPDGATDPAGEAGWFMHRERERRGITLEDVGAATDIHPYHLQAIEWGDLTRMPERTQALSMVGHYGDYLGFEPEPLMRHFARLMPRAVKSSHPASPAPLSSAKLLRFARLPKIPRLAFPASAGNIVAGLFAVTMLFGGAAWYFNQGLTPSATPSVAAIDASEGAEVAVTEEPMPDGEAGAEFAPAPQETAEAAGLDGLGEFIAETVEGGAPPQDEAVETATVDELPVVPGGRTFGEDASASRIVLKAKAPVWVRIEDAQGNVIMTQMLMAGDVYRVPDRDDLIAIARDGGLIAYEIDGKERGVLGPPGEILIGRSLAKGELESGG